MTNAPLWDDIINQPDFFVNSIGCNIAYHHIEAEEDTISFVCLHGYMSDMYGDKIKTIYELAHAQNYGFLALEYTGNHQSGGDFIKDGSISCWASDALELVQAKVKGKIVLIGSSMGGWLAFWLAKKLGDKVCGIISIAGAPDFTNDLTKDLLGEDGLDRLKAEGIVYEDNPYDPERPTPWTYKLYQDGQSNLVMNTAFPYPNIPVRLLHGLADTVVPLQKALDVMDWLEGVDVELWVNKIGDHRMSSEKDLDQLRHTVLSLVAKERRLCYDK